MYRFKSDFTGVIRIADELFISFDDSDPNKQEFEAWAAEGNLPLPPEFTLAELQAQHADAPILPLDRPLEWFEDSSVGVPQEVEGQWLRPVEAVDLRAEANLAMLKARLLAKLADVRYQHETGGIVINGAEVKTDRESQSTITGAYARAISNPAATVKWKADNGFVTLDAEAIKMFGGAVFDHVQGCFAREAELTDLVSAAGDVAGLMSIGIEAGWGA